MGERQRLSMLRAYTPADLLTLANASCGTVSVFACLSYLAGDQSRWLWTAFVLPCFALVFDVLDGYVARQHPSRQSRLGADLDSLGALSPRPRRVGGGGPAIGRQEGPAQALHSQGAIVGGARSDGSRPMIVAGGM